jgi:hypothetical protein
MKSFLDKFTVGRIFAVPDAIPQIAHAGVGHPAGFRTVIDPPIHLGHSRGKHGYEDRISDFKAGASGDAHRNFLWLPYIPGVVSEILQGNLPVLTGPLSGCPVTRYLRGGQYYVGHVGTADDPNSQQTTDAKKHWNKFAKKLAAHARAGCNVFRDLQAGNQIANVAPSHAGDGALKFWAIVMPNGDFYGMGAYSQAHHINWNRPFPVPQGGAGGTAWWRVALAPVQIQNSVWPPNGIMT